MHTPWKKSYDQPRQHIKKQRHYFADKGPSSQSYGFSSSHLWMWELNHKEGWELKNWCFWTVVLKETLESPLQSKKIKQVNPKGNQSWIFTRRTDAEAEAPILRPPDVTSLEKTLMLGKIEGRRRRGRQRMRWLDGIKDSMAMSLSKLRRWWRTGKPGVLQSMGSQRAGLNWATEHNDEQQPPIYQNLLICFIGKKKLRHLCLIQDNEDDLPNSFLNLSSYPSPPTS